jgi:hypothetical protein
LGSLPTPKRSLRGLLRITKKLLIYSLRRGDGSVIRIDLVNVNFGTIPTGFGGNADAVLTINGISFKKVRMQEAP